jgi:glycosyltransferase involved in cell wall biosynthesis
MDAPPAVTVLTSIASPYQVELFDALASEGSIRLRAVYISRQDPGRLWGPPAPAHEHVSWEDGAAARAVAGRWIDEADLTVFAYYTDPAARALLDRRASSGRPWCYWGERPGYGGWGWLGHLRRRWRLSPLHRSHVPIWGIGAWAVEGWRREFGNQREYRNVPYFSNLERFAPPPSKGRPRGVRRFLFSGSLIRRKGVDLLARAFARVAADRPGVRLDLVGAGDLEPALRMRLAEFSNRVRFLGFRHWPDLPACYHEADLLCVPSRYDGWALVVPEGLAAGLPVISSDRTGAALDLLQPGQNGWRVRAGSLTELAGALRQAADLTDAQLDAMSVAARASVGRHSLRDGTRLFREAALAALAGAPHPGGRRPGPGEASAGVRPLDRGRGAGER